MKRALMGLALLVACGGTGNPMNGGDDDPPIDSSTGGHDDAAIDPIDAAVVPQPRTVFLIPFENKSSAAIYGNTADAPYINGLLATAARATNFGDALPSLPSEPHYVWMEAGTNA